MTATVRLITIPFSHYCEKARWALDRCGVAVREDGHLPLLHWLPARRARGGRTVPIVVTDDGAVLTDSTDIVAWADARRPGTLLPADAAVRAEALALEHELDEQLGPATRRVGYWYLLPPSDQVRDALRPVVPRWESAAMRVLQPVATGMLRRGLNVTADGVARSVEKIDAAFAKIDALLADGRRYLVGGRFTVADLTFASLASPVLGPPEHPVGIAFDLGPEGNGRRATWQATRAGEFALRIYKEERRP